MSNFNYSAFVNDRNEVFNVSYDPEHPPLPLTLIEISDRRILGNDMEGFSLLFHGPKQIGCLEQGTWAMESKEEVGLITLFIVPVGEDEDNYKYEAIINQKLSN